MKFFKFLFVAFLTLSIIGCNKFSYDVDQYNKEKINENVQKVFGTTFDPSHDWCTATNGTVSIDVPSGVKRVQLLSYVKNDDGETSLLVLNEKTISNESSITLSYDVQSDNLGIYVAYISDNNYVIKDITKSVTRSLTRSASFVASLLKSSSSFNVSFIILRSLSKYCLSNPLLMKAEYISTSTFASCSSVS
jgi:hypothetical protein